MQNPQLPIIPTSERETCIALLKQFKLEGEPANEVISEGQLVIFWAIVFRHYGYIQIIACTQYGKSLIVALACIVVSCIQGELIPVVAPKKEQAKKIMRYYIEHIDDSPLFSSLLEKKDRIDMLRQEASKDRIVLRNGGGLFALSVEARSAANGVKAVMGEGGRIVIQDESALIPDEIEATIFRMIAGKQKVGKERKQSCYIKIGNPFHNNHFKRSWKDKDYFKIFINSDQALKEGRYTPEFLSKALKLPLADILYRCKFPDENEVDAKGYRKLMTSTEQKVMYCEERPKLKREGKRLGVDVARGGNWTAFIIRGLEEGSSLPRAYVKRKIKTKNIMDVAKEIKLICREEHIDYLDVFVDVVGVGAGVVDRLEEDGIFVNSCRANDQASDAGKDVYVNVKAEANFQAKKMLTEQGGKIYGKEFAEVDEIKWKIASGGDGKIQMESKDELIARGVPSPDFWDGLCFTYYKRNQSVPRIITL
ncbi:MAG: hypothetical protein WCG01_02425 [bacterium]